MWFAAIVGGVVTVTMSFLLYMERPWPQVLAVSVMAALIGTLLFTMALLSRPFLGPLAIDPTPFEQSISVFDDVDHGF
jgi:RsiW-degrading membrane proteinase PrsW (M82 family)